MLERIFSRYEGWAMFPVRVAAGWILMAHGSQKLFGFWDGLGLVGFSSFLDSLKLKPAFLLALVIALVELFGGLAVLLGAWAREAAFAIAIVEGFLVFMVYGPHGFFLPNGYEYNVALFAMSLAILFYGPGRGAVR